MLSCAVICDCVITGHRNEVPLGDGASEVFEAELVVSHLGLGPQLVAQRPVEEKGRADGHYEQEPLDQRVVALLVVLHAAHIEEIALAVAHNT